MTRVVAACPFRDFILIFLDNGTILRMYYDELTSDFKISRLVDTIPVNF